jgi:hypothetical protein
LLNFSHLTQYQYPSGPRSPPQPRSPFIDFYVGTPPTYNQASDMEVLASAYIHHSINASGFVTRCSILFVDVDTAHFR